MCGRYSVAKPKKFKPKGLKIPPSELDFITPRFNIAPSNQVAAIRNDAERHIVQLKWGLVPSWAPDSAIGARMINARAETLAEKPSFKKLLNEKRCAILADGFYEWAGSGKAKQPYFIHLKSGEPFAFAGLWCNWKDPNGGELQTCTIVTCAANPLITKLHDRMPVMLDEKSLDEWLDPDKKDGARLAELLKPYPESEMEAYPVSKAVNDPRNDIEACLTPAGSMKAY